MAILGGVFCLYFLFKKFKNNFKLLLKKIIMSNDSKPLMSESIPPSNHESHYYEDKGIILCDDIIKKDW